MKWWRERCFDFPQGMRERERMKILKRDNGVKTMTRQDKEEMADKIFHLIPDNFYHDTEIRNRDKDFYHSTFAIAVIYLGAEELGYGEAYDEAKEIAGIVSEMLRKAIELYDKENRK